MQAHWSSALLAGAIVIGGVARASEVVVQVRGARTDFGSVGCALFSGDRGFPMDNSGARQLWVPVVQGMATCRFDKVEPGTYAVSVGHDLNGNKRVDTNFLGIPTEGWAVSRNVVPTLRAPRFEEAAFQVDGDTTLVVHLVH